MPAVVHLRVMPHEMGSGMDAHERIVMELAYSIGAAQPSDFNSVLEFLVSYSRSDDGRKKLGELGALSSLFNYFSSLSLGDHNILEEENKYKLICTVLKILRNLCAGEISNQNSFIHDRGLEITVSLVNAILPLNLGFTQIEANFSAYIIDVCRMILQLLGNVSLAGDEHQSAIWQTFFPSIFSGFALIQNPKIHEPLCMIIYTCCKDNRGRLKELCGNSGSPIFAGLLRTSQTVGIEGDWLELLVIKICFVEPYFAHLFSSLRSRELLSVYEVRDDGDTFTPEQAYLLRVVATCLIQQMEDISSCVNSRECKPVLREFVTFLVELLRKAERSIGTRSATPPTLPTGFPAIDILGYSLNILRDLCAWEDSPSIDMLESFDTTIQTQETRSLSVVDSLISSDLVQLLIHLLRELGPPEAVKKATVQNNLGSPNPNQEDTGQSEVKAGNISKDNVDAVPGIHGDPSLSDNGFGGETSYVHQTGKMYPYKGYRRDIVSVLANATFRRKHVQDQVREGGGLFLLLQQCVVDENSPFLREWGLWAMRNLLEGNRENQREVAELELQNSVNTPAIAQMGLRVEIDQNTRRPKLINIAS